MRARGVVTSLVAALVALSTATAQHRLRPLTVSIAGGLGWPSSKGPLREFWRMGPAGSLTLTNRVSRRLSLGVGGDVAIYRFSNAAFRVRFPAVSPLNRKTALTHFFVLAKFDLTPGRRLGAFVQASIGAARLTPASYQSMEGGIRKVYYELPARARLALGLSTGADLFLSRSFTISAEARLTAVHNDPNAGIEPSILAGFRYTLP